MERSSAVATLTGVLEQHACQFPDRAAFVYEDEEGHVQQWTYHRLHQRAQSVAAWVAQQCEPGDRALLVYPPGLEFIAGFFGCLMAGVLPVPATYPKPRRPLPRLDAIAKDFVQHYTTRWESGKAMLICID